MEEGKGALRFFMIVIKNNSTFTFNVVQMFDETITTIR